MQDLKKYILAATVVLCAVMLLRGSVSAEETVHLESVADGLRLAWLPAEGADSYGIYRKYEDEDSRCIAIVNGSRTAYTDKRVMPGGEYSYHIKAFFRSRGRWTQVDREGVRGMWNITADRLKAGTVLTEDAVAYLGIDKCFYTEEISDEVFARMWKKSFKENCTTPREELRYIRCLHWDIEGKIKVGELVMHRDVADTVCGIFRELFEQAYPIESMILVDEFDADDETSIMANNTSAFNFRTVDDTDQISNHAYGLAIDINPYYNVYYIPSENYIFPPEGWEYLDREADFPYKLAPGDLCYNLFTAAGFEWGGWWTYNTDYQHFQYVN